MGRVKARALWAAIGVALLALGLRWYHLGDFMTADEAVWMLRSGDFWHKLEKLDPAGTFETTHPGATVSWLAGAGIVWQEYRLGQAIDTSNLALFRRAALIPLVIFNSFLIGLIAWLLWRLKPGLSAFLAAVFLAADPYLVGLSQVIHLDALLALFMLASALAFGNFMANRNWRYLSLAAVLTGGALATKTLPALWLWLFIGIVLIWSWLRQRARGLNNSLRIGAYYFGLSVITFALLWPALWAKHDNLDQYVARDTQSIISDEHVVAESSDLRGGFSFYITSLAGRSSGLAYLGIIGIVIVFLMSSLKKERLSLVAAIVYAVGFLVIISLAAKKGDRYALPALAALPIMSGWAVGLVMSKASILQDRRLRVSLALFIVMAAIALPLAWLPDAVAYNNILFQNIRPLHQQGWGEGLEQAAAWLNQQPDAANIYVASWYPTVLETYFRGRVWSLSSRNDNRTAYVVTYRNMGGRGSDDEATNILDEYKDKTPVHIVKIMGVPYVWIYDTGTLARFDRNAGELLAGKNVEQTLQPVSGQWQGIELGLATFSGQAREAKVTVHIRQTLDGEDIRTVSKKAESLADNDWNTFNFEAIEVRPGESYVVVITSANGRPGDAATVKYSTSDIRPGNMTWNEKSKVGDIAYKLIMKP